MTTNQSVSKGDQVLILELHPAAPQDKIDQAVGKVGTVRATANSGRNIFGFGESYCMRDEILVTGLDTFIRKWIKLEYL